MHPKQTVQFLIPIICLLVELYMTDLPFKTRRQLGFHALLKCFLVILQNEESQTIVISQIICSVLFPGDRYRNILKKTYFKVVDASSLLIFNWEVRMKYICGVCFFLILTEQNLIMTGNKVKEHK